MQTDYKNLSWFEASTVAMIVLGIILTSGLVFNSLPEKQQHQLASAWNIFDFHEQVPQVIDEANFVVFELPQSYLEKFYQAFQQVAAIPQENIPDFSVVPQGIKLAYQTVLDFPILRTGQVLGASIDTAPSPKPYRFFAPKINLPQLIKVETISLKYIK